MEYSFIHSDLDFQYASCILFQFQRIWLNEKLSDDLLKYEEDLLNSVILNVERKDKEMQEMMDRLGDRFKKTD